MHKRQVICSFIYPDPLNHLRLNEENRKKYPSGFSNVFKSIQLNFITTQYLDYVKGKWSHSSVAITRAVLRRQLTQVFNSSEVKKAGGKPIPALVAAKSTQLINPSNPGLT